MGYRADMSPRRLLLAVLASWLVIPVTCTIVAVPTTRLLIESTARDLQAGEKPHLHPVVAMVDRAAPGKVELVPLEQLAARRAQATTLTAWLPEPNGLVDSGKTRVLWRPVPSSGSRAREMEVLQVAETHTHTFRYAVSKDGAVTPLRSTVYDMSHPFLALALGLMVAVALRFWAAIARGRLAVPPPLPPSLPG
jgi:hypothetical protein